MKPEQRLTKEMLDALALDAAKLESFGFCPMCNQDISTRKHMCPAEQLTSKQIGVKAAHRDGMESLSRIIGDINYCLAQVNPSHLVHAVLMRVELALLDLQERQSVPPPAAQHESLETGQHENLDIVSRLYTLLVRRGYAQWEADSIANGPGCGCVERGEPSPDCFRHGIEAVRDRVAVTKDATP
jgi:hypothetical protein